jgi:hypothetical protein
VTVDELRGELMRLRIPEFAYSVGGDQNESYCLVLEDARWHLYYSERGNRNSEQVFTSESEACEELLRQVLNDRALRDWMKEHLA